MGEIEPEGQYLPDDAEHDTQVDKDNAPKVLEYLPAPQLVQTLIVCFATSVAL